MVDLCRYAEELLLLLLLLPAATACPVQLARDILCTVVYLLVHVVPTEQVLVLVDLARLTAI